MQRDDRMIPSDEELDAFKSDVRTWIEVDNSIRMLQEAARERRAAKRALSARVLGFMSRFNIEDLNTRDGSRLRFQVRFVRSPLSHGAIKDRIDRFCAGDADAAGRIHGAVFGDRERTERSSLRRLPPPRPPPLSAPGR